MTFLVFELNKNIKNIKMKPVQLAKQFFPSVS